MEKMNKIKNFLNDIELHMASVAICITTVLVISNVFFRYGLGQQFLWTEEVALGGFVWTVYLGSVAAYKRNRLMGVDALLLLTPPKVRIIIELIIALFVFILNATLTYMSFTYTMSSRKVTAALEVSYVYINSALVVAFFLMSIHAANLFIQKFKQVFLRKNKES